MVLQIRPLFSFLFSNIWSMYNSPPTMYNSVGGDFYELQTINGLLFALFLNFIENAKGIHEGKNNAERSKRRYAKKHHLYGKQR